MEENGGSKSRARSRHETATIRIGLHVRFSKEKIRFAKAAEHNFNTEILTVAKVIERRP